MCFAARIFASVSAIVQPSECVKEGTNSVELGYTRNYTHTMGLMWGGVWLSSVELIWRQDT
ncbi:hypothetical protein EGT39_20190 [Escherichia coli]|nr:hypothetical protein EGT39_20190 [Escherichia coli]